MFIKINNLYFDTDKIESLGIFEEPSNDRYEIGIVFNNARFCIYSFSGYVPTEMIQEAQSNIIHLLEQIVECARVELKELAVPKIDVNKYIKEADITVSLKKEPLND